MVGRLFWLLALCALSVSCSASSQSPLTLALEPYIGRLVSLDAEIDGQHTPMLFDTGAGVTALTPEKAALIDCTPYGRLVGHRMSGERVEFQRCGSETIRFNGYEAAGETYLFDLMALLPDELPELGGIVSLASFYGAPITLDLAHRQLILETKTSLKSRVKNATEGDLRVVRGVGGDGEIAAFVRVEAATGDLWFLLDSANLDHVFVSPHALDQLGARNEPGQEGAFPIDLVLAGGVPVSAVAQVRDILYDGALNEAVMSDFLVTLDLEAERVWFAPNPVVGAKK